MDRNVFLTLTVRNVPIVALRKESVDRNGMKIDGVSYDVWVALRKESVDRNITVIVKPITFNRRSPQGERG